MAPVFDAKKAVAWIAVLSLVGVAVLSRHENKRQPEPTHEVEQVLAAKPEPAPLPPPPPVRPPPVVTVPVTPKVVVTKQPTRHPAAAPARVKPKFQKPKAKRSCASVPKEAYEHDKATVLYFAEKRGITPDQMKTLKACIGA